MRAESTQAASNDGGAPKLRAACENCRQSKVKCNLSGKNSCIRCLRHGLPCRYRVANRSGKPKGSKNRATLRKLGQLQEEKLALHNTAHDPRPVSREKSLPGLDQAGYINREIDRKVKVNAREPFQQRLSASPNHDTGIAVSTAMLLSESPVEYPPSFCDPLASTDPMCAPASMSPTFLQKEFITKGLTSFPLAVHIPSTFQPACDCGETLGLHTNHLRHMVVDSVHLRFDQSLQALRTALTVCQAFLQCTRCHKNNTNLLLCVSTLDLTLQLFDYCVSYEFTASPGTHGDGMVPVAYGEYETSPDETRRIRRFLLRSRLGQCQATLGLVKGAVEGCLAEEGGWLVQMTRGYEATVEAFLQTVGGL